MRRLSLLILALPLALFASACGGGSSGGGGSVGSGDAAVVGGQQITQDALDARVHEAKCSYQLQKKAFPKAGSAEFEQIQSQILSSLVRRVELTQKAPGLKVTVTDKQVADQLTALKKQYFGGDEKKYQAEIKRQCVTDALVRGDLRANLLSDAIFKKVTASAVVSAADARAYYDAHREVYTTPQTRVVRHILVKDKALADKLYAQLKAGADFATLAKKYSIDPGSKSQGGQLTITKGQTVPQFDKVAFALRTGQTSKPVHTQFGWHIIFAEKPAKPRQSTPFAQVKEAVRQQLLQQKRNNVLQVWLGALDKEYASKVKYANGLAPATTSTTTPAATTG